MDANIPDVNLNHVSFESRILWEIHFPEPATSILTPDTEMILYLPVEDPHTEQTFEPIESQKDLRIPPKRHKKTYKTLESLHQLVRQFKELLKKFKPDV